MRAMPWPTPERAAKVESLAAPAAEGCLTGVDLSDVRRLRLSPVIGPFGRLRPPLDRTAMALSLELAYMTYTLDLEPWMRAGWDDVSIQVDNRLQSGVTVGESESAGSERIRNLMNTWKMARARMALREFNPVAQVMGAFRQRDKSDTIKAVTMIHPSGENRYVVAIGFMGTGSRFYDWFSNFRFTTQDGFHKGFYQLTQYFEQSADKIQFPDTAAKLGLPALTLANVLDEMRSPQSRFSLWMAGHSQGGAVMQIFCHRLITRYGVLPCNMVGYGFASPTTAVGNTGRDPAAYPLFHVLNPDDMVPRIGAIKHLGLCLQYQADEALRDASYGWSGDAQSVALRADADALLSHVQDTPTMLETMAAFLETIAQEKTEENLNALLEKRWSIAPLDKAFSFAGGKAKESLARMIRYTKVAYHAVTGRNMEMATVEALGLSMIPIVRAYPVRKLFGALSDRFHPPHMLCRAHREVGAYGYIVRFGHDRLKPFIWEGDPGETPRRVFAQGVALFTPEPGDPHEPSRNRRRAGNHSPARHSARLTRCDVRRACHEASGGSKTQP